MEPWGVMVQPWGTGLLGCEIVDAPTPAPTPRCCEAAKGGLLVPFLSLSGGGMSPKPTVLTAGL